jgi:cytosine/adenosine deaminase-related metal-dependent hydrolase
MAASSHTTWTLTARWLFPVESEPLPQGTITVSGDRIAGVEPAGQSRADYDLGNAAILPGLVNAHTHLDLSGLRGRVPPSPDFTGWLQGVIQHRRRLSVEQARADVQGGLTESMVLGTTLLGDISAQGQSWPLLANAKVRAVVYHELLGLPKPRASQAWTAACDWLRSHTATLTCRPGLSPHSPYSVRRTLFRAAARLAQARALPVAIHLAETPAEQELLGARQGPLVPFLSQLGVWDGEGLVSGAADVLDLYHEVTAVALAHGNYLVPSASIPRRAALVYCPRSHAAFGHASYPLAAFLDAGVRVALGTDSLASNPDLSVLAEARFVRAKFGDIPGATILRMATLSGAEALGWQHETGTLATGKSADLAVVALPDEDTADPHELLLHSSLPVTAVFARGLRLDVPPVT